MRLTPDVTYNGRPLTAREYADHLALLREIAAAPERCRVQALRATTLRDESEQNAWIAIAQAGLLRQYADGKWDVVVLSEYGALYLAQRTESVRVAVGQSGSHP